MPKQYSFVCPHCAAPFTSDNPQRQYCSSPCWYAAKADRKRPLADRFWEKVDRSGGPDACWLWTASLLKTGYGAFGVGYEVQRAHRIAWELTNGPIPAGLLVCHACDVRRCCNPSHCFLGTYTDNNRDMAAKGRHWRQQP